MIKANRSRILVKLADVYDGVPNPLNLTRVDQKKHYDHKARRGVVESVGSLVHGISVGDVVVFRGDAGFSLDGDPEFQERQGFDVSYRWLKESDCLAKEEKSDAPPSGTLETKVLQEA